MLYTNIKVCLPVLPLEKKVKVKIESCVLPPEKVQGCKQSGSLVDLRDLPIIYRHVGRCVVFFEVRSIIHFYGVYCSRYPPMT